MLRPCQNLPVRSWAGNLPVGFRPDCGRSLLFVYAQIADIIFAEVACRGRFFTAPVMRNFSMAPHDRAAIATLTILIRPARPGTTAR